MTAESYERVMDTNLKGPFFLTQQVARIMIDQLNAGTIETPKIIILIAAIEMGLGKAVIDSIQPIKMKVAPEIPRSRLLNMGSIGICILKSILSSSTVNIPMRNAVKIEVMSSLLKPK